jgi:serpin B
MNAGNISAASFRGGLIATLLCFLNCDSLAAAPANQQELASANSGFAFNLLKQLVADQAGTNIFISPYSASTVLQMVSTGAAGTTRTEMQQMLGTMDMRPAALNEANKEIGAIINSRNTNFVLTTANSVWYRKGTPIKASFIAGNEQFFGAKVEGLNFSKPAAVEIMNAWASEETQGKIERMVSAPIDPRIRLFLANAVYFHGKWESPFSTNDTKDRVFQLSGGGQTTLPMMEQTGSFSYCEGNGYQAVRLSYRGGDLAMYVFLPGPDSSVEELLGQMDGAWWQQAIQADFAVQQGTVVLPKFNLNCAVELKQPLEALGMETAFTPDADFSNMSSEALFVSSVRQQAVVEVNEEGTEAAAVTVVTVVASAVIGYSTPPFQMIVDRPFLFIIEDQQAGTILFMGAVFEP